MIKLVKAMVGWVLRVLFAVEYEGLEGVPGGGGAIIAANHPSYLDPVLIGLPLARPIRFMAWDALFRIPLLGVLIRHFGAFPVDLRPGHGEAAYREARRVLAAGEALGIFPEGQRSERGPMGELRMGAARLAIETGAPIIPVTIGGASRAWPKHRLLPKPAKIIVRFHPPIRLDEAERTRRRDDRDYHREITARIEASINRSLAPALRTAATWERWYRQPPSHIRTYEWAPLLAALVATAIAAYRSTLAGSWIRLWLPVAGYYLYLIADLALLRPARLGKWLRNSMPIWLILAWHADLTRAVGAPFGSGNGSLIASTLAVFFLFFYQDYHTLQKFVRGLVVVYYFALALQLGLPHPFGYFIAVWSFILLFHLTYRLLYDRAVVALGIAAIVVITFLAESPRSRLAFYAALAGATLLYLQTFISAAYDIRRGARLEE
jgi:1-acyl-sn-glycerol-3-phosphate acyltransferase